ncbi:protein-disulfide reductase DsbD domain-containing protein [Phreatobacter stygius]|uniref:Cytochrome C biogenesis protein n=1 Tax=Phreatobacter stygius TaxID=1940610 RepID=A0A4D7AV01_9HYPH|nr:protein-disulfide reductase DsbD domain-containing protein [Phreatobacter stygius]QCI63541.1 cytochrome C biogenesis protein [Phreatobacter stygius]
MIDRRAFLSSLAALAAPGLVLSRPAFAGQAASDWSRDSRSAVRLIGAGSVGEGAALRHRAGLQITLSPGTKTYWRTPGDSGVPPMFDWAASDNVANVQLTWPAPHRFADGGGQSIGYKIDVVFPIVVTPRDPAKPVELVAKIDYAVCDNICIPAKGEARLGLTAGPALDPALASEVAKFAARVPVAAVEGMTLSLVSVDTGGAHPVAVLAAQVGPEAGRVDLFAEGPDGQWSLPLPEILDTTGPVRRFKLTLDGAPRGVKPLDHPITFTLVAGPRALETRLRLA